MCESNILTFTGTGPWFYWLSPLPYAPDWRSTYAAEGYRYDEVVSGLEIPLLYPNPNPPQMLGGAELVDKDGGSFRASERLAGKVKLLYFSAHWCPPCRGFTPELVKAYAKLKAAGRNFEVVFISSDRDPAGFKVRNMPGCAGKSVVN